MSFSPPAAAACGDAAPAAGPAGGAPLPAGSAGGRDLLRRGRFFPHRGLYTGRQRNPGQDQGGAMQKRLFVF